MTYTISSNEAQVAVSSIVKVGNYKDDAMLAFVTLFGAEGVNDLTNDPGSEEHDGATNALGALEFWAKA